MMGENHIYSQFLIRNCWQGQKIFCLESVAHFLSWVRMNLVGFDFFSALFLNSHHLRHQPGCSLSPQPVWDSAATAICVGFSKTQQGLTWQQRSSLVPRHVGALVLLQELLGQSHPARVQCDNSYCCFLAEVHG